MPHPPLFVSVVGARPNFMKLAPLARALASGTDARHVVVHTGQHHDPEMSETFFRDLALAPPHHSLQVGSGSHAQQTATVMYRLEPLLQAIRPDWLLVYGDVNSTVAAALTATKLGIRVAHVEAGLRSRDRTMPEEINRVLTDHCADLLLAPSPDAVANLRREGIPDSRVHLVGNIMIDSLVWALPKALENGAPERFSLAGRDYAVVTLHRPSNVDDPARLESILATLTTLSTRIPILFPVHPRTKRRLAPERSKRSRAGDLRMVDPLSYIPMLSLIANARMVITDSGGVQEETSFLGVPCVTLRTTTERPITVELGTNRLVSPENDGLLETASNIISSPPPGRPQIPMWDGHTADRIVDVLLGRKAFT